MEETLWEEGAVAELVCWVVRRKNFSPLSPFSPAVSLSKNGWNFLDLGTTSSSVGFSRPFPRSRGCEAASVADFLHDGMFAEMLRPFLGT